MIAKGIQSMEKMYSLIVLVVKCIKCICNMTDIDCFWWKVLIYRKCAFVRWDLQFKPKNVNFKCSNEWIATKLSIYEKNVDFNDNWFVLYENGFNV